MNAWTKYVSSQFKNPKGIGGILISLVQNIVNREMYKKTVSLISLNPNEKFLDIGYGNGHLLEMMYKKKQVDLFGIDISEDAKNMAIKRNKKANQNNHLHLCVGDVCSLPYEKETFSAVASINTIYFWTDPLKGLSQIYRTIKEGASFYNVMYTKDYLDTIRYTQIGYKKFEDEELIELGKAAGFGKIEKIEIVKNKSFVLIFTK